MKRRRRQRQRMLVLLGAVVLLAVVLIVIISSCSKKNQGAGITAQAFSTGSELTLPVNTELNSGDYVSYGGYQFETGTKLSKMAKLITKNNENVTATSYDNAYGSAYLFTRDTGSGVESWCLYQKDPAHIAKWYIFMGNHREVEFSFEENDESSWFTLKSTIPEEPEPSSRVQLSSTDAASTDEPTELSEADALTLSKILIDANYKTGTTASEYPYKASLNGTDYMLELTWKDDTWSASVQSGDQTARLTTKQACTVAAVLASNGVMKVESDESSWPDEAGTVSPMGACMVTTNDVNVRSLPSTNGNVLMTMLESSAVAVCGQTENDWYQIVYNDKFAYMSAQYLKVAE